MSEKLTQEKPTFKKQKQNTLEKVAHLKHGFVHKT